MSKQLVKCLLLELVSDRFNFFPQLFTHLLFIYIIFSEIARYYCFNIP